VVPLAADASHLAASKTETVPGLSDQDQFLLYVGNYYPYKVGRLLEAFAAVSKDRPNLKLVLGGKADEFQRALVQRAHALGLQGKVLFTGFISDGQLKWLYAHAVMFVYPSLSEGFGLQGLEAMTQGLPVVSSNASCLPEVYGNAAEYFDPRSVDDLAGKIKLLLDDHRHLKELQAAGRERVKQFSWRRMATETLEVYAGWLKAETVPKILPQPSLLC
jgi:glycosyltransferase involved in cell wall biosynthesis